MKNLDEISSFVDTVDLGEPIYDISLYTGWSTEINMAMEKWQAKQILRDSDNWIEQVVGQSISRRFEKDTGEMALSNRDEIMGSVRSHVYQNVPEMLIRTSPADQPKRTKAYKEMKEVAYNNRSSDSFINDLIPIVSYYVSHVINSTESNDVHRKNIFGLLDILRKKYGNR